MIIGNILSLIIITQINTKMVYLWGNYKKWNGGDFYEKQKCFFT